MKRFKTIIFFIIFQLLVGIALVSASDVAVVATVDKNEATLEDYIVLQISVEGTRHDPNLPSLPDFKVTSRGSSSRMQIINGQMSSSVEYHYILYPRKAGTFTIGPFWIEYKGRKVESNRVTLRIGKGASGSRSSRDLYVTAEVDNDKPYLYEQIVYTFKFYRKVKVANAGLTEAPSFEGFIAEEIGKNKEYQRVINGQTYVVTEIKWALMPAKTGVLEITPPGLRCDVVKKSRRRRGAFNDPFFSDPFFGFTETVPKSLRANPVTVMVQQLPESGKPKGFNNLVGSYALSSKVDKKQVAAGESVTLTLVLAGTGNLKNHKNLEVGGLQAFKVYDDKPVFEPSVADGKVGGKLTIKKALVPLSEGLLKIPAVAVSFFDPASASYKTIKTGSHKLNVLPGEETNTVQVVGSVETPAPKEGVKILGRDILPVHTSLDALSARRAAPEPVALVLFLIVPFLAYAALLVAQWMKQRNAGDSGQLKLKNAYKQYKKNLAGVQKKLKHDEPDFYQQASKALKDFIGDKLRITGSSQTTVEIESHLQQAGISETIISEMKELFTFFDSGQYGFKQYSPEERRDALETLKKLVETLNKKLKT